MNKIIELESLTAGYGDTDILHDINLHVDESEIVVIIGPNGAGKSTAMKAIFGLLKVRSGKIRFNQSDITNFKTEDIVAQKIAFVPQTSNVFPNLSIRENLEMGAFSRKDNFDSRLSEIFDFFPPLKEKKNNTAASLSGGQRQMLALGRALMTEPSLLMLDEPTAGLSPKFQSEILNIVQSINNSGTPILIVEQNAKQALAIADRGYVFVDGKNRINDKAKTLLEREDIAQMFLGGTK